MADLTTAQLVEKVKTLLGTESDDKTQFLQGLDDHLMVKVETVDQEDQVTNLSSALGKLKIGQATKLRKFQKGENFATFCERFQEYCQITQIVERNLHLFFLQHVDDVTYSTLKAVHLKEEEKHDCTLFCEIYKEAIYGSESVPLKNEVLECKQLVDEDITSFAHRLREKAAIAFSTDELIDENCLLSLMRGIRNSDIRRKLNESSASSFTEALRMAKKLEKIGKLFKEEPQTSSILKNSLVSFSDQKRSKERERSVSPAYFERAREPSKDSTASDKSRVSVRSRSASPWNGKWESGRYNNFRSRSPSPWEYNRERSWGRGDTRERSRSTSRDRYRPRNQRDSSSRRRDYQSRRSPPSATPRRPGQIENRRCWFCNRRGHLKRDCYARNRSLNSRGGESSRPLN